MDYEQYKNSLIFWMNEKSKELDAILLASKSDWFETLIKLSIYDYRFSFWDVIIEQGAALKLSPNANVTGPIFMMKYTGLKDLAYFLYKGADRSEKTTWGISVLRDLEADFSATRTECIRVHQSNQLELLDSDFDNSSFVANLVRFAPLHNELIVDPLIENTLVSFLKDAEREFVNLISRESSFLYEDCSYLFISDFLEVFNCSDNLLDYYLKTHIDKDKHNLFFYYYLKWDFYNFSGLAWHGSRLNGEQVDEYFNRFKDDLLEGYQRENDLLVKDYYLSFIEFIESRGAKCGWD